MVIKSLNDSKIFVKNFNKISERCGSEYKFAFYEGDIFENSDKKFVEIIQAKEGNFYTSEYGVDGQNSEPEKIGDVVKYIYVNRKWINKMLRLKLTTIKKKALF